MKDTVIRRILLAGVTAAAASTAGCMLIISSDEQHRDECDDDCEDCHTPVVIVDLKQAADSSGAAVWDTVLAGAHRDAPVR